MTSKTKFIKITFSAQEELISLATKRAEERHRTLNDVFCEWLEEFTKPLSASSEYQEFMASMGDAPSGASNHFRRDRANER